MGKMSNSIFPRIKLLKEATVQAMETFGNSVSVKQINSKVIEILDLPDKIVQLEDETGQGTI